MRASMISGLCSNAGMCRTSLCRVLYWVVLTALSFLPCNLEASSAPHWIRLDSDHFSVLTDGGEKKGREVLVRFEQMRAAFGQLLYKSRINMAEPIDIIAVGSEDEYEKAAPPRQGSGLGEAFFISGEDRYYFVLNLSRDGSWRAISGDFAQVLLNYNYPPTQRWFDVGFSEYFSSLRLSDTQMQIGGDPGDNPSFATVLNGSDWLSLPELFAAGNSTRQEATEPLLRAESWIVMHYLLNKEKLPAAGAYFGALENEKLPVEEAIQKAFGMSSAQLLQAVKDYLHSIPPTLGGASPKTPPGALPNGVPAPVTADVVGMSNHEVAEGEAQALVAEMKLRVPEHRDEARKELSSIMDQPKMDNVVAHRAMAWDAMEKKDYEGAIEKLGDALAVDNKDPMTHYYLALCKFRQAHSSGEEMKGLANMMQDLHVVLDWKHEFAEAYYMLGVAQTEGGGLRAAADSIRTAIQLSPRRIDYLLELARIYEDGKSWDAATALLERLSVNSNAVIASAAKKDLHDLPYIKKYGILPADSASSENPKASPSSGSAAATPPSATGQKSKNEANQPVQASAENNEAELVPAGPQIDKRPVRFAKGKLVSVDCSQAPAAMVTITAAGRTMKLRTADYKSLTLVGEDTFSCDWANRPASVNYKAGGKADGDLVSLEVH